MTRRLAAVVLACVAFATAGELRAQQLSPRDVWQQVMTSAREGDLDAATKHITELLGTGRSSGLRTFPFYAASAAAMASESEKSNAEAAKWAAKSANALDPSSPVVAFSASDRAAAANDWGSAVTLALQGYGRLLRNYRTSMLSRADLLIAAALALAITAIVFAVALFIRYGRSMAHDFREVLGAFVSGGTVTVLAVALLFLPIFLWLGPMWLVFYWFAIFFAYSGVVERIAIVVLLILIGLLPIAMNVSSRWITGVDSPVVSAAVASQTQSYQPDALRRLQELIAVVPDQPMLYVLLGNLQAFEGADDLANLSYRRAIELRGNYAGAHVNLGNLYFLNNEFQAAITEYERAQRADPELAIAFYNHSVAAGETYKFDTQARMLEKARAADRATVEKLARNPPPQKIVMYHPEIAEAWNVTRSVSSRPAARALFGNYSVYDPLHVALNPVTIGAVLSLLLALILWSRRRRTGFANACIKCGRTFCYRCKSARESTTYCTQCIHIYLKRDGVSLETKRQKLEEVSEHQSAVLRRNRLFATFLPGSAQMMEGRTTSGTIGIFVFALFVAIAIFSGRLAPALGPVAEVAQMLVRVAGIVCALIVWIFLSLPVYRRRSVA